MKESVRMYNIEDAKLSTEASRIKNNVSRDIDAFKTRKVDNNNLVSLQTSIDAFDSYPTDEELEGDVMEMTTKKDELARALRVMIRPIRNMADTQYHGGGKYRTFGFKNMDSMDDNNLYRLALRVVRVGNKLMAELQVQGLTAAMLTDLSAEAASFHTAMDAQDEAIEDRDLATQERINLGNALYGIVVQLASIGKSLFEDNDEARYNDYVLYDEHNQSNTPPPPSN